MNKRLYVLVILWLFVSCSKDSNTSTNNNTFFPPVAVKIDINLSLPQYNILTIPQGWVYESGGNRGVVVYHTINDDFVAFDRTCPVESTKDCAFVSMDSSNTYYKCSQYPNSGKTCTTGGFCLSKFDAANGFPISGSAKMSLKQYFVKKDGNFIHISSSPL